MYDNFFKTVILLTVFFLGVAGKQRGAWAQSDVEDSLKNELSHVSGKQRFEVFYELFRLNATGEDRDLDAALSYIGQAYEVARAMGDSLGVVRASYLRGRVLVYVDLDEAIKTLESTIPIAKRNSFNDETKSLLNTLAVAYTYAANYDKALRTHFESLTIREAEGDKYDISISYNNIGLVYYKLKDHEQALKYFLKALELKREVNDLYDLDRLLLNIGLCYNALRDYDMAIEYLNEGINLCGDDCADDIQTEGHYSLGIAKLENDDIDEARNDFELSLRSAQRTGNKRFIAENLVALNSVAQSMKDPDLSLSYLQRAERLLDSLDYNELKINLYSAFADFYLQQKNFEEASLYQGKYIHLKDSIYSDELIRNLAKIQTNYEERQNRAIIASQDEALIRQQRLNIAIVVIAVLTGLLVFVLYRSNLVKKRVNLALSDAKAIIEDQNRQLTSLNRNLEKMVDARTLELQVANEALKRVNDELDNFIYKTSHDIRGPLASLKGMCNVAIMDVKDPTALEYFYKLDATAEKLNTILTRLLIINQINNSSASHELIDFNDLVDDVIVLERKRGLPPNLAIRKEIDSSIVFYSDKELVRIILENLIDNAIKFYNDSDRISPFVLVRVERDGQYLRLRVIDNGIGISQVNPDKIFQMFSRASERSGTGGIGLYLTKTATEKIGGHIDLKTTQEGYTEFYVRFSLSTTRVPAEVTY